MRLLTIDAATNSGWAFWAPGAAVEYGSWRLPGGSRSAQFAAFQRWLIGKISLYGVDFVSIEERVFFPSNKDGKAKQSFHSTGLLFGLAGVAAATAGNAGVEFTECNNATFRTHFVGRGASRMRRTQLKKLVTLACKDRGWHTKNDDEADALAILDYEACRLYSQGRLKEPWPFANGLLFAERVSRP